MKKTLFLFLVLLLAVFSLAAYDLEEESPTSDATEGLFSQPYDLFMSITDFSDLEGNYLFLDLNLPNEAATDESFEAGISNWISDSMYLGFNLDLGLGAQEATLYDKVAPTSTPNFDTDGNATGFQDDSITQDYSRNHSDNGFGVIFGMKLSGLTLGISNRLTLDLDKKSGTMNLAATAGADSTIKLEKDASGNVIEAIYATFGDDGFRNDNNINETFMIGTSLGLGSGTLKPALSVTMISINNDGYGSSLDYTTKYNPNIPDFSGIAGAQSHTSKSNDYLNNSISLGGNIGADYLMPIAGIDFWAGLNYGFNTNLYKNDIRTKTTNKSTTYNATWDGTLDYDITDTTTVVVNERSGDLTHIISIPLGVSYGSEGKFNIAFGYQPSLTSQSYSTSSYSNTDTTLTDVINEGDLDEKTTITVTDTNTRATNTNVSKMDIDHIFTAAAQIALGERMTLNLGTVYTAKTYGKTVTVTNYTGVNETTITTTVDSNTPTSTYSYTPNGVYPSEVAALAAMTADLSYQLGLTFKASDSVSLDLINTVDDTTAVAETNIWQLGTWDLMVSIKY